MLERRAAAGVVVWKLDRLVRRPAEFERFRSLCESHDVSLASATEPIDSSTELGLVLVRILVTFASLESATIAVRTRTLAALIHRRGGQVGPAAAVKVPAAGETWLSTSQVMATLSLTRSQLYRAIDDGAVPAYRFGRVIRIRQTELDDLSSLARPTP